ncbi:DUF3087 domain-containing protein [Thalassotalea euphylliae]|uniref:DUF3087 domain-containing protein n=1 Tax=Thalassotalea euphylliae TaxID=1655234 RepID=A0A3E0TQQ1_9GAMM|nr:DUF3087 family protein [Thalassotalea euphylliae]REL26869.1 DUF3087 domain-containing protein [Thalassotalea euphylliae]
MKIETVNKANYRKKLNQVTVVFVILFALLALVFGSLFIALFAEPIVDPDTQSNFRYNLGGVILALVTMGMITNSVKRHEFLHEIYYVWRLKQLHNSIYRKLAKIKAGQIEGHENAKIILAFYYQTLKQVYELDNNTLTINNVNLEINKLQQKIGVEQYEQYTHQFEKKMLENY